MWCFLMGMKLRVKHKYIFSPTVFVYNNISFLLFSYSFLSFSTHYHTLYLRYDSIQFSTLMIAVDILWIRLNTLLKAWR